MMLMWVENLKTVWTYHVGKGPRLLEYGQLKLPFEERECHHMWQRFLL